MPIGAATAAIAGSVISGGLGFLGSKKQAGAVDDATEAQILWAENQRDYANDVADDYWGYSRNIINNTNQRQRGIVNDTNRTQRNIVNNAFDDQWGIVNKSYDTQRKVANQTADEQARLITDSYGNVLGEGSFGESPGYNFRVQEALDAIEASAAARGGLFSGATGTALQERANDLAGDEFGRWSDLVLGQGNALAQIEGNRGTALGGIAAGRGNALYNTVGGRADDLVSLWGGRGDDLVNLWGGRGDALVGAAGNRANVKIGANADYSQTMGSALSDQAYGNAAAYQNGLNSITNALNTGFNIYGAAGGTFGSTQPTFDQYGNPAGVY